MNSNNNLWQKINEEDLVNTENEIISKLMVLDYNNSSKFTKKYFSINFKKIYYLSKKKEKKAFISLNNISAEFTFINHKSNLYYQIIIKNEINTFKIWFENKSVFIKWHDIIGKMSTLTNFHQNYEVLNCISQGNSAKIFKVKNLFNKKNYACKALNKKYLLKNNEYDDLKKEVNFLRKINHPNIINFKEYYETSNSCYIITELIEGGELFNIEDFDYSDINNCLKIIKQICEALIYLDSLEIMHRDLKPSNILIKEDSIRLNAPKIVIIDFGISDFIKNKNFIKKYGTPGYTCPTILRFKEKKSYDNRCDIFSLGIIFYTMLTNDFLFQGTSVEEIFLKNYSCSINYNSDHFKKIDSEIKELLRKMLEPDCMKRINIKDCNYLVNYLMKNLNVQTTIISEKNIFNSTRILEKIKKYENLISN